MLFVEIIKQRTAAVCRIHVNARSYRVGVGESHRASALPNALEVNVLRPVSDALVDALPTVSSRLLSMLLNSMLNAMLDYFMEARIMFNYSVRFSAVALLRREL